jgi:hypothetical protein
MEVCTQCMHPRGSHIIDEGRCGVPGCSCMTYVAAGQPLPAQPTPASRPEPTTAEPDFDEVLRAKVAERDAELAGKKFGKMLRDNGNVMSKLKVPSLSLLIQQINQAFADLLLQNCAREVFTYLNKVEGRRVVLTSTSKGMNIQLLEPDGSVSSEEITCWNF